MILTIKQEIFIMKNILRRRYLRKEDLENLKKFKYNGQNDSIVYNKIVSPFLDNYFMKIIPLWVPPNLLTILSFVFNLITFIIFCYETGLDFNKKLSRFSLGMQIFSHFMYILLDNADGKQARRTKTSSPLGLLLDHGLDAITASILSFNLCFILNIGNESLSFYFLFLNIYISEFFVNYEEYRTGKMILQIINNADEGNLIVLLIAILGFIFGQDFWHFIIFSDIRIRDFFIYISLIGSIFSVSENINNIVKDKNYFEEVKILIVDVFWIFNDVVLPLLTYIFDRKFYYDHFIFIYFSISLIFLRITIELLIDIVCKRKFRKNNMICVIIIIWYTFLFANLFDCYYVSRTLFLTLYYLIIALFMELIKFLIFVTYDVKTFLGLNLLTI